MAYTVNDIDKILISKLGATGKRLTSYWGIDCELYTNLGIDSTKTEFLGDVKKKPVSICTSSKCGLL